MIRPRRTLDYSGTYDFSPQDIVCCLQQSFILPAEIPAGAVTIHTRHADAGGHEKEPLFEIRVDYSVDMDEEGKPDSRDYVHDLLTALYNDDHGISYESHSLIATFFRHNDFN